MNSRCPACGAVLRSRGQAAQPGGGEWAGGRFRPTFRPCQFFLKCACIPHWKKKKKKELKMQAGVFTFPQGWGQYHFSLGEDHSLVLGERQWTFDLVENRPQVALGVERERR